MEEEITERRVARRPLDAGNEDQPQAKRPRQLGSAAASRDPAAAAGPTPKTHEGGSKSTGVAAEARTVRMTASSGVITLRGVSLHRSDGNEMARLLSTVQDAVRKYTPNKVDEASNVRPDWRYNDLNILLPHQVESKRQGLRSIGRRKASAAISDQVLGVLADMLPNHESLRMADTPPEERGRISRPNCHRLLGIVYS